MIGNLLAVRQVSSPPAIEQIKSEGFRGSAPYQTGTAAGDQSGSFTAVTEELSPRLYGREFAPVSSRPFLLTAFGEGE